MAGRARFLSPGSWPHPLGIRFRKIAGHPLDEFDESGVEKEPFLSM